MGTPRDPTAGEATDSSGSGADVVIVAAGPDGVPARWSTEGTAYVIAADGGADRAAARGLEVDLLVGDLDSVGPDAVDAAAQVHQYPTDKDATDLELALEAASQQLPDGGDVRVLAVEGGRPDHALANLLTLTGPRWRRLRITVELDAGTAHVIHGPGRRTLDGEVGQVFSVLPVHGDAVVSLEGARWCLDAARLQAGTARGISNEFVQSHVECAVHEGTAIVVRLHPA